MLGDLLAVVERDELLVLVGASILFRHDEGSYDILLNVLMCLPSHDLVDILLVDSLPVFLLFVDRVVPAPPSTGPFLIGLPVEVLIIIQNIAVMSQRTHLVPVGVLGVYEAILALNNPLELLVLVVFLAVVLILPSDTAGIVGHVVDPWVLHSRGCRAVHDGPCVFLGCLVVALAQLSLVG